MCACHVYSRLAILSTNLGGVLGWAMLCVSSPMQWMVGTK